MPARTKPIDIRSRRIGEDEEKFNPRRSVHSDAHFVIIRMDLSICDNFNNRQLLSQIHFPNPIWLTHHTFQTGQPTFSTRSMQLSRGPITTFTHVLYSFPTDQCYTQQPKALPIRRSRYKHHHAETEHQKHAFTTILTCISSIFPKNIEQNVWAFQGNIIPLHRICRYGSVGRATHS